MAISISSMGFPDTSGKYNPEFTNISLRGQLSKSLLGGLDTYDGGISSALLYKIYDFRAITPITMAAYTDKMKASETDDVSASDEDVAEIPAKTNETDTSKSPADELPVTYSSQLAEGRGYDLDALQRIKEDMDKFYSDPKNVYKEYQPVDVKV
ncbi:MAG: hypothetical protein JNL74_09540 [Fibrobacteres bacterium]|nr:hypothetical protein [Fibrobacterota bacterium]